MKRARFLCLLFAVWLTLPAAASAQSADTVRFGDLSVPRDAEEIDLGGQTVSDWDAFEDFLRSLPALRKADLYETVVEAPILERFSQAFPDIRFGFTIHITHDHYIRTDQTAFSTLHGRCPGHQSDAFAALAYCRELRALDLGHNDITDLSFLAPLTKLRVLILACNPRLGSREDSLAVLRNLPDLEYLELFSCGLRDVTPLADLPHLLDLNLAFNRVSDESPLFRIPTLRRLWVSKLNRRSSAKTLAALRAALPEAEIVDGGQPTDRGWRVGPHYETIYEIFHTDRYVPFADSFPEAGDEP